MKKIYLLSFLIVGFIAKSQELNCNLWIESDQIQTQEKQIFKEMENAFREFMNNTVWTDDEYKLEERIQCNISIRLTAGNVNSGNYSATAQVQAVRPIYGVSYESETFQFVDQYFNFSYRPGTNLIFDPNVYSSNLTSMLGFYAYMILGFDYDSFSSLGGTPHFETARTISNTVPNGVSEGWSERKGPNNRWALIQQAINPQMEPLRKEYYRYHRLGMDKFAEKQQEILPVFKDFLVALRDAKKLQPLNIMIESIMMAKRTEIINIYEPTKIETKQDVMQLLKVIDPTNISKYQEVLDN